MGNDGELLLRLGLTLVLCFCIGLEREIRVKSAGLRTLALVGLGAAVAMMVSKHGFDDLIGRRQISLDPSRVAAQIVSGVGFLGAGLIFVRRDSVRGLTTAAVVWFTAMVGMAVGAGLYVLAVGATAAHFIVVSGYPILTRRVPGTKWSPTYVNLTYLDGKGVLRDALTALTGGGHTVADLAVDRATAEAGQVQVSLVVYGKGSIEDLVTKLSGIDGVLRVGTDREDEPT